MRWTVGLLCGLLCCGLSPSARAEDVTDEEMMRAMEAARNLDPEILAQMEYELDAAQAELPETASDVESPLKMPEEAGAGGLERQVAQAQADPRMEDIRRQYESGRITEAQATDMTFKIFQDYGFDPNSRQFQEFMGPASPAE